MTEGERSGGKRGGWGFFIGGLVLLAILLGLGTWQVQRLHWKEELLAKIDERIHSEPVDLAAIEEIRSGGGDIEYRPVTVRGTFENSGERHFLATWKGQSGFNVYTPLRLDDGRYVFVNRGFVPYDRKDPATRQAGELQGEVEVTGLARTAPAEKQSFIVPDNTPGQNIFYWKDLKAMAATAGLPKGAKVVPFYIDADDTPNPGGLPVGGVTIIDLPNNHLQYALTWYGLAAVLLAVMVARLRARRREFD
jgi:surfeit locus 1 family protein